MADSTVVLAGVSIVVGIGVGTLINFNLLEPFSGVLVSVPNKEIWRTVNAMDYSHVAVTEAISVGDGMLALAAIILLVNVIVITVNAIANSVDDHNDPNVDVNDKVTGVVDHDAIKVDNFNQLDRSPQRLSKLRQQRRHLQYSHQRRHQ